MNIKALIVEDDRILNDGIRDILRGIGIDSFQVYTISRAIEIIKSKKIDIVILDINLPDGNGLEFCLHYKKNFDGSVIIISALDMDIDVVRGLELGADDYVTKPFSMLVLRARVQNALKKQYHQETIFIDNLVFDFTNMIYEKDGLKIQLSVTEQKVLKLLVTNRGNVIPIDTFLEKIWDCDKEFVDKHALTVTIKRLREKIEKEPSNPKFIKNIYGIGYMWKDGK